MNENIKTAVTILQQGGVIIFPTDTVWGIGCRLDNENAIKRVFKIRNRPEEKAVLAVVDSLQMAQEYVLPIPDDVRENLMEKYWPLGHLSTLSSRPKGELEAEWTGGLTIILPCRTNKVPSIARGGGKTLAVRQTNHKLLLEIIKAIQVPIIAPSANFAGEKTPVMFSDLDPNLLSLVDFVLSGESLAQKPSTIVDCSVKPWKIIREGAVEIHNRSLA